MSRSLISLIERGHFDLISLAVLRRVAKVLDITIVVNARWRAGDLDRLLNAGHSALHEAVARYLDDAPGWLASPEVSFAVFGERGIIDILAFHAPTGSLLVIELKTDVVDVQEMVGTFDRKQRLALGIARDRGWIASSASSWLVIAESSVNRRRVDAHRVMLRNAYPQGVHELRRWVQAPVRTIHAMSFLSNANRGSTNQRATPIRRVRTIARRPPEREASVD